MADTESTPDTPDTPDAPGTAGPGRIYLSPPDLSGRERELLLAALDSGWVAPVGPDLDAFEAALAEAMGVPHVVAASSGTAGLHLALHHHGIGPGDEVLVSTLTFVASANAVVYTGATPVFVDAEADTWCLDPGLVAEELERRRRHGRLPKAVVAVDLYGQCADYDRLVPLCRELGVVLVEDAAEALGATYRGARAGSFGDVSVVSFNGNKIITTSGGGAVGCHDRATAEHIRTLATQARLPVLHYEHTELGFNYRLSNLLAAVGRGQLEQLEWKVARRRAIKAWYRELFGGVPGVLFMPDAVAGEPTNWLTCITVDPEVAPFTAAELGKALEAADIESRPVWKPMHLQPLYAGARVLGGAVAERLFATGWCLPSGSGMTAAEQERIAAAVTPLLQRV